MPIDGALFNSVIGTAIQSAARQEGVFQDSRWQPPLASNNNSAMFCENHYCMLALRKKIFVYAVISICIITTPCRHYLSVQIA